MKQSDELKKKLFALNKEISESGKDLSKDKITPEILNSLEAKQSEIEELIRVIKLAEKLEENDTITKDPLSDVSLTDKDKEDVNKFSLSKFLESVATDQKLDGVEAEVSSEMKNVLKNSKAPILGGDYCLPVMPSYNYYSKNIFKNSTFHLHGWSSDLAFKYNLTTGAAGGGSSLVPVDVRGYSRGLFERSLCKILGLVTIPNLTGDVVVPTEVGNVDLSWSTETGDVGEDATFALATDTKLTPKRIGKQKELSIQLLIQANPDIEVMIWMSLMDGYDEKFDYAVLSGPGGNTPTGIINHTRTSEVAIGTNGGALTHAKMVELSTQIYANKGKTESSVFIGSPKVIGRAALNKLDTGSAQFLYMPHPPTNRILRGFVDGNMHNQPCYISTNVPDTNAKGTNTGTLGTLIYGDFMGSVVSGRWSNALEVIRDPYTKAKTGEVVLTFNAFSDVIFTQAKKFAYIKDAATTA